MKETVMDPSPKNLLRVLGIKKATKKASVASPAPKKYAITTSRAYPRIRLRNVADPTTPAALAILSCSVVLMEWDLDMGCIKCLYITFA
jgi:hypothetical protein